MVDLCTYIVQPKKMAKAAMISPKSSLARRISFPWLTSYFLSARGESVLTLTRLRRGAMYI